MTSYFGFSRYLQSGATNKSKHTEASIVRFDAPQTAVFKQARQINLGTGAERP